MDQQEKNKIYNERNRLLAFAASLTNAFLTKHPIEDTNWESDWRNIVVIDIPMHGKIGGQMTWHIHDSELYLFDFLPTRLDFKWDGHTTEEKYKRLELATRHFAKFSGDQI